LIRRIPLIASVMGLVFGLAHLSEATVITVATTDLADVVSGQNLQQMEFQITGRTFVADEGFTLYFDPQPGLIQDVSLVGSFTDWDMLLFPPSDPADPLGGFALDALALLDNPQPLTFIVNVSLTAGAGLPAAALFTINGFDRDGNFQLLEEGVTTPLSLPNVPEPGSILLLGSGLTLLARRRALILS
jgi:hypothetical protein